jgi:hypothetical protein
MREEIEHACMVLEWVRRRNPDFASQMETYLFTKAPITEVEEEEEEKGEDSPTSTANKSNRFTIGNMKEK